jgi:hypothetical protein
MIKVGAIQELGTHFHTANRRSRGKRLDVNMEHARLNHYCMRIRENSLTTEAKWSKVQYKTDLIKYNDFFKAFYDPTAIVAKKLLQCKKKDGHLFTRSHSALICISKTCVKRPDSSSSFSIADAFESKNAE